MRRWCRTRSSVRDGVDVGIAPGINSIVQPGGSERDFESIVAATGVRGCHGVHGAAGVPALAGTGPAASGAPYMTTPAFMDASTLPFVSTRFPFTKTPSMPVGGASLRSRVVLSFMVFQLKTVMSAAKPFLR